MSGAGDEEEKLPDVAIVAEFPEALDFTIPAHKDEIVRSLVDAYLHHRSESTKYWVAKLLEQKMKDGTSNAGDAYRYHQRAVRQVLELAREHGVQTQFVGAIREKLKGLWPVGG